MKHSAEKNGVSFGAITTNTLLDNSSASMIAANGPLGAIVDALELSDSVFVVIAPNDTPFFSAECFARLIECVHISNNDVAVAVDIEDETHVHWLLSVWRKAPCLPMLREQYQIGTRSVHEAVVGLQIGTVAYESALVCNVNSPEDLVDEGTI